MWVKICGNTRLADALLAAGLGADALGFIFAPGSRRLVPVEQARGICSVLAREHSDVERVGVFTSGDAGSIAAVVAAAGLTAVQLHGAEAHALAPELRLSLPKVHLYAAAAWSGEASFRALAARCSGPSALFDGVLVDSPEAAALGGTGRRFDWEQARPAFTAARSAGVRAIAAGGLDAGNVTEVIRVLQPWGVDVASGTESSPGIKDAELLRAFLAAARG